MKKFIPIIAFTVFSFMSCSCPHETASGTLNLQFTSTYQSKPLVLNTWFPYGGGGQIKFDRQYLFLSDIRLMINNSWYPLKDIELLEFTDVQDSETSAKNGLNKMYTQIPEGGYSMIQFTIGVNSEFNKKKPADFPSSSPLSNSGNYWTSWNSYIFSKLQGFYDIEGDGTANFPVSYHLGTDTVLRTITLPCNLLITENGTAKLHINYESQNAFLTPGGYLNLKTVPNMHSNANVNEQIEMANNYSTSFSIQ